MKLWLISPLKSCKCWGNKKFSYQISKSNIWSSIRTRAISHSNSWSTRKKKWKENFCSNLSNTSLLNSHTKKLLIRSCTSFLSNKHLSISKTRKPKYLKSLKSKMQKANQKRAMQMGTKKLEMKVSRKMRSKTTNQTRRMEKVKVQVDQVANLLLKKNRNRNQSQKKIYNKILRKIKTR